ncbi:MAG TPA: thiamine phosphate synthase [Thermodesulfovibrionales bacterium]|nr:thiamine phosphate synthase [Thermodesulfovibrionales bacterium]
MYLITDRTLFADVLCLYSAVEEALKGGAKAVQLREKDLPVRQLLTMAYTMRRLTSDYHAALYINDRVDVAIAVEADGVHLGLNSVPVSAAKKASGDRLLVGVSTHSFSEAVKAEKDGTDFITFGPVYPTPSKLRYGPPVGTDALREVCSGVTVPVFAIGGITPERTAEVKSAGARGVAVISALLGAHDREKTTERFLRYLQ